ncbi:MAG: DUF4214 domain-containing protein [Gammaproteobacteria bacterium]|nr:DUF4214 domain-containing protein [Gammaproteobacteria bacterium]HRX72323.1 DUF4214 domain-containing protein [Candidatus Competibacteraceae bacterium]
MTRSIRFSFILLTLLGALAFVASRPAQAAFSAPAASTIAWFYAAAFGRSPLPNSTLPDYGDLTGLTFWTDVYLDGGAGFEPFQGNVNAIADFFVASDEFQAKYPASLTNEQFVTALYENMLSRSPDLEGFAFWVSRLEAGDSRGTVLANFANTLENQDSNATRKAALQAFIAFIAADANGTITPTEAATWLAANPSLDGAIVDGTGVSEAPQRVELVSATSLQSDRIQMDWLATFDNDTPSSQIRYLLHASLTPRFVPTRATVYAEVVDAITATMTGLSPETLYYVKVEASDGQGHSSWSNELSVTTAASTPDESAEPRQILDADHALGQTVTVDQVRYQLPTGQTAPQIGDLLVSPEGEGFLRRATSVNQSGSQVTVQTEPAALNEAFDNLEFSTDVRLIDVPQTTNGMQALSRGLRVKRSGNTRQLTWPESGLTLIQTDPPAPVTPTVKMRLTPTAADTPVVCNGSPNGQRRVSYDTPLKVTYPGTICVEPRSEVIIDVSAEIESSSTADYEVTQLLFLEMTHPKVPKNTANYGAEWTSNASGSDTLGKGTLRWTPQESQVDDQLRPYTARFVAKASERKEHCVFGFVCDSKVESNSFLLVNI